MPRWPTNLRAVLRLVIMARGMARAARRFSVDTRGTAAVEFALVATPFFLTLFSLLEVSMIYVGSIALDNGMQQAARLVRTGQTADAVLFRDTLCAESFTLLNCGANLYVDVDAYPSFAGLDLTPPVDEDGNPLPGDFNVGSAGDVVMVRAYYVWPVYTPGLKYILGNIGSTGSRLLMSTTAFRNEPYGALAAPAP